MQKVKELFKNKEVLLGLGLFTYFFMLLLGVLVPTLRLGSNGGFSIAFIYRSVVFSFFFFFTLFAFYKKYHSINYVFGIFLLIFFLSNILAIFIPVPGVSFAWSEKFMAFLYLVSVIFTLFAFFEVLPHIFTRKSLITILVMVMITMGICCLYSLIKEGDKIIKAFIAKGEDAHFYQIMSFFDNKNSYGVMVFVAIIANVILYHFYRKKWLFIPLIFFLINLILSRCKTSIVAIGFVFIVVLIYLFFATFEKHQTRNVLIVSALVFLGFFGLLIVFTPEIYNSSKFLSSLSNYVREAFIGQSIRSIQARINHYIEGSAIFLNPRIILGYGEHLCIGYANSHIYHLGPIDNAFVYNLLAGGIFKTTLFVYIYYKIVSHLGYIGRSIHRSTKYKVCLWCIVISILLNGLMENYQILGSNHLSFIFLIFSFSLLSLEVKEIKEQYGE